MVGDDDDGMRWIFCYGKIMCYGGAHILLTGLFRKIGNRGHLTLSKQVLRILGSFWNQIRVAFSRLRLIRSPDEERRNR